MPEANLRISLGRIRLIRDEAARVGYFDEVQGRMARPDAESFLGGRTQVRRFDQEKRAVEQIRIAVGDGNAAAFALWLWPLESNGIGVDASGERKICEDCKSDETEAGNSFPIPTILYHTSPIFSPSRSGRGE